MLICRPNMKKYFYNTARMPNVDYFDMLSPVLLLSALIGTTCGLVTINDFLRPVTFSKRLSRSRLTNRINCDSAKIPLHTYKADSPFPATVISVQPLHGPNSPGETFKIDLNHSGKFYFWEGQSCGVIPPGLNPKTNKPFLNRLYSIASSSDGDFQDGNILSLCVKRVIYRDMMTGCFDMLKHGVCSNFLCDAKPGDVVNLTGPTGKVMIFPENYLDTDFIMIATGTGIAPIRALLRRLFAENRTVNRFKGKVCLYYGAANQDSVLFYQELRSMLRLFPSSFNLEIALSREQTNENGGKFYVYDKVNEHGKELFERMLRGAHLYCCGVKGMMPNILRIFEAESKKLFIDWNDILKGWKKEGRWHVEVY